MKIFTIAFILLATSFTSFASDFTTQDVNCSFKVSTITQNSVQAAPKYYGLLIKVTKNTATNEIVKTRFLTGLFTPGVGATYAYPPFSHPTVTFNKGLHLEFGDLTVAETKKLLDLSEINNYPILSQGFSIGSFSESKATKAISTIEIFNSYYGISYELVSECKF